MKFETQTNLYGDIPLAERFKALDTQFAITQGHIDALISETELQELLNGDKTMYSAMNDIKIDVNGLRANLTSLTTEVDGEHGITAINNKLAEYEGTIDGFSANFERITEVVNHTGYNSYTEAVQAKIDAGIDGFNSTIQSTYYTKNDVYTKSEVNSELQGVSGAFTSAISNVQSQIDNKIETWCRDGVPTASNYPASDWTTSAIKDQHIGDLYYDTKNGYAYQFTKQNNVYSWNVITTSGIGDALTLAGNKRRVFVTEPTPPYEIGDLWVQGESGDIMRCGTPRASGNYTESDWVKASKYTDDSTFNTFKTGQYAQDITAIGAQLDNKVEIHYGTVVPTLNNAPANSWSTSERAEHLDDLYYNTSTGYCYRFIISGTTYSWVRIKDSDITSAASVASTAQSIANGKATIFTGSTTPALPRVGDLWLKSANDDILTYVNDTDKWQKYNKYTDDTTANQVATNLTNNYSTTTQIQQNSNGIITTAISNVDGANFISQINQTAESISIDADKINLSGYTTINGNFSIDDYGKLTILSSQADSDALVEISGDYIRTRRSDGLWGFNIVGKTMWINAYDVDDLRIGALSSVKINNTSNSRAVGLYAVHDFVYEEGQSEESALEVEKCGGLSLGVITSKRKKGDLSPTPFSGTSYISINYLGNEAISFYKPIITNTNYINGNNNQKIYIAQGDSNGPSIGFYKKENDTAEYSALSVLGQSSGLLDRFLIRGASIKAQTRESVSASWSTFFETDYTNKVIYVYNSDRTNRARVAPAEILLQWWDSSTSKWQKRARLNGTELTFYSISANQQDNTYVRFSKDTTYPLTDVYNGSTRRYVKWTSV